MNHIAIREIKTSPRGKDGLFIQPKSSDKTANAEREIVENHHRETFANHFNFSDPFIGNTRTYDDHGRYNCGRCNQAQETKCLLVAIKEIDLDAGSCRHWENLFAGDSEMWLVEEELGEAGYGIAKNGIGFGCNRCPYASPAYAPDSLGRELYCGVGDFRTFGNACCSRNGAEQTGGRPNGNYDHLVIPTLSSAADSDEGKDEYEYDNKPTEEQSPSDEAKMMRRRGMISDKAMARIRARADKHRVDDEA